MTKKKYWKGLEELNADAQFIELAQKEFPEELPLNLFEDEKDSSKSGRRDFLKMMGFSLTAATIAAGCEIPVQRVAPYIFKPEDITPGIATWYATSFISGGDYCSILVKTREGRPIKIEGNKGSKVTQGGTSARVQASVLSLYDTSRLSGPMTKNASGEFDKINWADADKAILGKLAANPNAQIRILTSTVLSKSTKAVFAKFIEKYPNTKTYSYDAVSYAGLLMANEISQGKRIIPDYHFSKAKVVVSFDADFLGTWISPIEYTKDFIQTRKITSSHPEMSRHYQIESRMSITGSNADYRIAMTPSESAIALLNLYDLITGSNVSGGLKAGNEAKQERLIEAAEWLKKHEGESIVVCGSNDVHLQLVTNAINEALGNYNQTISFDHGSMLRQGNDTDIKNFILELKNKQMDVAIIYDCNPVYDTAFGEELGSALAEIPLSISFASNMDETAASCKFICPDNHYLESWNDAEPKVGMLSLAQPTIQKLFDTRQIQDSLLTWAGIQQSYADFLMDCWSNTIFMNEVSKTHAFNKALQSGLHQPKNSFLEALSSDSIPIIPNSEHSQNEQSRVVSTLVTTNIAEAVSKILSWAKSSTGIQICLYEKIGIGDGRYANNPWLQELPDPISKITWDNYVSVSPTWADENKYLHGDIVTVACNSKSITLPLAIQPGQAYGSVSIALGYGRSIVGKVGQGVGANAFALVDTTSTDCMFFNLSNAEITSTGKNEKLSQTQTHFSLNDGIAKRRIVKETTLAEYKKNPKAGNKDRAKILEELDTFYPDWFAKKNGFNWSMSIDLNSCTGCSACVIACSSENNVPVVGKHEVLRAHEMHWIRIDRYYAGDDAENPEVVFQPMLCQHCENAPCENVCPVGATNHSQEGFNQMAYNRCIGTRYCANNCPYKVRRFNWFDYGGADTFGKMNDPSGTVDLGMLEDLTRMVLNPDVTVRSRGVIEKCSFCVQRIQESKLTAKKENRQLRDGDIRTACQSACPADAIVFGNLFDESAEVSHHFKDDRAYGILEEYHWLPSLMYLTKVRNKDASDHVHDKALDIMDLYNYQ